MKSAFFTLALLFFFKYAYSEAFDYYEEEEETEELLCSRYFLVSPHFFTNFKSRIPIFHQLERYLLGSAVLRAAFKDTICCLLSPI